ncbi:MAG: PKD domain-containing protein, partial [Candidatus Limnocylindrales bacterium]
APGPVAVFTWSPSTILVGTTVSFNGSGSSGDPTDWQWDFGDGDTAVGSATVTHTYGTAGPFTVTLTAINTTGTDSDSQTITVTSLSTPTPTPTATTGTTPTPAPTPTPTPFQCYPPNVIGQNPSTAQANLIAAAFTVVLSGDLTNGQKNKIQAQNPDHTTCLAPGATISIHYRPN